MSSENETTKQKAVVDYEIFLLGLPLLSTLIIWFWVSGMNLLQRPGDTMSLIMLVTVIGTAIIAALEASKLGMVSDRKKGTYGPTAWFFLIMLLWIVCYPIYLLKRKSYGLKNRLVSGIIVAIIFMGSWSIMSTAIDTKISEVKQQINSMRR